MLRGLLAELPGRVWEGKQVVPGAVADVLEACPECVVGAGARDEVVRALVAEAGRKKAAYREAAIEALRRALAALAPPAKTLRETETENDAVASDADFFPAVMPLLRELLQPKPDPSRDPPGHAGSTGGNTVAEMEAEAARVAAEAKTDDAVAILGLRCSATLCAGATRDAIQSAAPECASLAADALAPAHGWARPAAARAGGGRARRRRGRHRGTELARRAPPRASPPKRGWRRGAAPLAACARRTRAPPARRVAAADGAGGGGGGARLGLVRRPRGVREAAGGYARRRPRRTSAAPRGGRSRRLVRERAMRSVRDEKTRRRRARASAVRGVAFSLFV